MGLRSLPFFKSKKGWQFAGGGLESEGGGSLPIASADVLGGVKIGFGLTITAEGVLSSGATFSTTEFDTGLKTHDNKTIYGRQISKNSQIYSGQINNVVRGLNVINVFGYYEVEGSYTNTYYRKQIAGFSYYHDEDLEETVVYVRSEDDGKLATLNVIIFYTK